MAEYRLKSNGEIKTQDELRLANKNMSFPKIWSSSVFDALGVDPVLEAPAPTPSSADKIVVRNGAVQDSKNNWVYAWIEKDRFTEYTDSNGKTITVAEQKTAYDAKISDEKAVSARNKRDGLLSDTDHYALSDVTMSDEMKTYRQALRDVPQQTDFPTTISWPTKP